jgi:hypothetical protein
MKKKVLAKQFTGSPSKKSIAARVVKHNNESIHNLLTN